MPPIPLALLPCCVLLRVAGLLIPPSNRSDWMQEWLAEAWAHYAQSRGLWRMYRAVAGCLHDAWWHFTDDSIGKRRLRESLRSPGFCLASLVMLFAACVVGSGLAPATRAVLEPLPYGGGQNRIAVISRAGRLEAVRRGVPGFLAADWKKHSMLLESFAVCLFPRKASFSADGKTTEVLRLAGTPNLFQVLGVKIHDRGTDTRALWISTGFWKNQFHGAQIIGQTALVNGQSVVIAGVLPPEFWFLSPAIEVFELDRATFAAQGMLVVRSKPDVSAQALESDLVKTAADEGYEFAHTAPHAIFLRQAMQTPLWLFGSALFIAGVLVALAYGSRWMRVDEAGDLLPRRHWAWWSFFLAKTTLGLLIVLVLGIELFVGRSQQAISDALGGPALIWFYITGCSFVLFTSISDQRSRCRVCQRLLTSPIRIGCPGCLLLDWAGTEFLCPHGHGVLYVPHHVACWEEQDRWVLLEV
jgi:hypothetical protein